MKPEFLFRGLFLSSVQITIFIYSVAWSLPGLTAFSDKIYLDVTVQVPLANCVNGNKVRYSVLVNLRKKNTDEQKSRGLTLK